MTAGRDQPRRHTVTRSSQRPTRRRMTPWSQHPLISATKKARDKELAETKQKKDDKNVEIKKLSGTL